MRLSEGAARRRRIVGHLVSLPQRSGIRRMNPRRMSVDLIPWSQGHLFASQATPKEAGGPVAPEDGGEGGTETKSLSKGGKIWAVANMYSGCDGARTPEPNGN